jgi:hypothetical protein
MMVAVAASFTTIINAFGKTEGRFFALHGYYLPQLSHHPPL